MVTGTLLPNRSPVHSALDKSNAATKLLECVLQSAVNATITLSPVSPLQRHGVGMATGT